jgi:hypothetical protein
MKKEYLFAENFAKASLSELFGADRLKKSELLSVNYLANTVLINDGNWNFTLKELPWQAQLTSYRDAAIVDANNDDRPDILLGGNYYNYNIQLGRYDADFGTILINQGNGNFGCESLNGMVIKGEIRHIKKINAGGKESFLLAKNNDSLKVIQFR